MKSYRASYKKLNGQVRRMHFAKIQDLPKGFIKNKSKNAINESNLGNGLELVWDLDNNDFRVFNWKTVEGAVKEEEVNFAV
jgi:hypothetical protein